MSLPTTLVLVVLKDGLLLGVSKQLFPLHSPHLTEPRVVANKDMSISYLFQGHQCQVGEAGVGYL